MDDTIKLANSECPNALVRPDEYATWLKTRVQRSISMVASGEARLYSITEARSFVDDLDVRAGCRKNGLP